MRELATLAGIAGPAPPQSDIRDNYWPTLGRIESVDRPYVPAASSSAFTPPTSSAQAWLPRSSAPT